MQITSNYNVPASQDKVWHYLTTPKFLQQCIPGCEKLEPLEDESTFEATIKVGIASIKGTYQGNVKILDKKPPSSYRLVVDGKSKIGFLNGFCDFTLEETGLDNTQIGLVGELNVGGKLARVGQRIIRSAAKMTIGRFFKGIVQLAEQKPAD